MKKYYVGVLLLLMVPLAIVIHHNMSFAIQWVHQLGFIAPIVFGALFCVSTLLFLPTFPLVIAAGALFGPVWGVIINLTSATTGAICAFLISRYIGLNHLPVHKQALIQRLVARIDRYGWKSVMFFRLVPMPFSVVNYGFGLTKIKISHYIVGTFIFIMPYKIIGTYCGTVFLV